MAMPVESFLNAGQEGCTFIREGSATVSPDLGLRLGLCPGPQVDQGADQSADPQAHQEAALGPSERDHNSPTPCNSKIFVTVQKSLGLPNGC